MTKPDPNHEPYPVTFHVEDSDVSGPEHGMRCLNDAYCIALWCLQYLVHDIDHEEELTDLLKQIGNKVRSEW
jgi:hypothetical protein